ncbi:hypothetical protein Tco_0988956 [Tanacetum coccineum]|uniref:Uncharacterized protein n=1 Tax=Tanacetum coccineum TaxID=301880 RepID=A0ABQ5ETN6_9ASTR
MKKKDSSKEEEIKQESKEEVKQEDKEEESTRKRKAGYKEKMNSRRGQGNKIPEGFDKVLWGDLIVMFNPEEQDEFWNSQHEWNIISWKLHSSSGVHTLMTDEGIRIGIVHQALRLESWLVRDQTVLGKDKSNLLIADSLLKTIWFINAPCYGNEALASPNTNVILSTEQNGTGKGKYKSVNGW